MAREIIQNGTVANDGTGDNLRVTADKINRMFTELYGVFQFKTNGDLVIKTVDTSDKVYIGDPTCNHLKVPGCGSGDPITIGKPDLPVITVPTVGSGEVKVGNPGTGNTTIGNSGTGNTTVGNTGGGSSTFGNSGGGDGSSTFGNTGTGSNGNSQFGNGSGTSGSSGFGNAGTGNSGFGNSGGGSSGFGNSGNGNSNFGNSGNGDSTFGNTGSGTNTFITSEDPWQVLYSNGSKQVDSSQWLKVSTDSADSEGKSLHLAASTYDLGFGNSLKQRAIYFTDPSLTGDIATAYPSKRVASIRWYDSAAFGKGIFLSPNYNYNDTAFPDDGFGIWRQNDNGILNSKVTLNGTCGGPGIHGVAIGRGAISFFQDLPSWDTATDKTESEKGLTYITLPAIHTGNNGEAFIGQISVNPYKIRRTILSSDPEYIGGTMTMGIPYFSLGSKRTNQLIENEPAGGFEKDQRTPGHECIIWDVNCRVELGDTENDRGIKIPGTENPNDPIEIGGSGGLKIPTNGSSGPSLGNPGTGAPPSAGGGSGGANGGTPASGNAGGQPGVSVPAPWDSRENASNPENPLKIKNPDGPIEIGNPGSPVGHGIKIPTPGSADAMTIDTGLTPNRVVWTKPDKGTLGVDDKFKYDGTSAELEAAFKTKYVEFLATPSYASTFAPDWKNGTVQTVTLTGNITFNEPVDLPVGGTMTVIFKQDGTGSRTISYQSGKFIFASGIKTLTTTANAVDMLNIFNTGVVGASQYMCALTTNYRT